MVDPQTEPGTIPEIRLKKKECSLWEFTRTAITLLEDGYFSFDNGIPRHIQLWWFPEYDANLGLAKGDAKKRNDGTWMREFQNGMVIVNPTGSASTIDFMSTYQDVTTGTVGSHFVVSPEDGRIFVAAH